MDSKLGKGNDETGSNLVSFQSPSKLNGSRKRKAIKDDDESAFLSIDGILEVSDDGKSNQSVSVPKNN